MFRRHHRFLAMIAAFGVAAAVIVAGRGAGAPAPSTLALPEPTPITQTRGLLAISASSSNDINRVDLHTGVVTAKIPLQPREIAENSAVTTGEGSVFVLTAGYPGTIVRIDPASNLVAATFTAPDGATSLRAGAGGLWVSTSSRLTRLDPIHGMPIAAIALPHGGSYLALGAGSLWILSIDGAITRVDPTNNSILATIHVERTMSQYHRDMAFGDGYLWVRVADVLIAQIDPATNTVVARYGPTITGGGAVAVDNTALWKHRTVDYFPRPAEDLASAVKDRATERPSHSPIVAIMTAGRSGVGAPAAPGRLRHVLYPRRR